MNEFEIINNYFRKLAKSKASLNLNDDIFFDKKNYLIKGWETIDLYGNKVRSNIIVKNINQELSDNIFNLNLYN